MCGTKDSVECNCEVKVTELENGYQVHITGEKVKDTLKAESIKKCIEMCCSGKIPFMPFNGCCR